MYVFARTLRFRVSWCQVVLIAVCGLSSARPALGGYTAILPYKLIPPPPDTGFDLLYISNEVAAGGEVAATTSGPSGAHAVRWDAHGAIYQLGAGEAWATNGSQEVGFAAAADNHAHAMLWNGTAQSAVDLHPTNLPGITDTIADGTGGSQQVGYGYSAANPLSHALMWNGTASSVVDLNPSGFDSSEALGTDGTRQVGNGQTHGQYHALIWSGSASSAVDLNPSGFGFSYANGISGDQVVGAAAVSASDPRPSHAMLWDIAKRIVVDLSPTDLPGVTASAAYETNGVVQVGVGGDSNGFSQALVWNGTAASAVNLTPPGYRDAAAYSVDPNGNVFGLATDASGTDYAIEWAVPEPSSFVLLVVGAAITFSRRRRITFSDG